MHRTNALAIAATALTAHAVSGQVEPVGTFTGEYFEGFEGKAGGSLPCVQNGVFAGLGQLCASMTQVTSVNSWNCTTTPRTGGRFFISTYTEAEFTFDTPVVQFGGYFAAGHPGAPGVTMDLFDASGTLIESVQADVAVDCAWTWAGWSSPMPVARVVVRGNAAPGVGGFIGMDDMQASTTPPAPPPPPPPPACYADCDTSTGVGVLDLYDVLCFQESFLAGDPYACEADTSSGSGVCDILDFIAYMDSFLAGCEPNDPPSSVPMDLEGTVALLSSELLDLRDQVWSLDGSIVTGRNARADWARRWIMAWHLSAAHDWLQAGELRRSSRHLHRFLARVDGVYPRWDWVSESPERDQLAVKAGAMIGVIDMLRETYGDGDRWRRVCKFRRGSWRVSWRHRR